MKEINIKKTLKIATACIAGLAMITIPLTTIVSCSSRVVNPRPSYEDYYKGWNWESFARGEWDDNTMYDKIPIPKTINKFSYKLLTDAGLAERENIFFSDWVGDLALTEYIGNFTFYNFEGEEKIKHIEIPEYIKYIGDEAFHNYSERDDYLTGGIKFADNNNVLRYGFGAFAFVPASIRISPKIIKIDMSAFYGAKVPECTKTGATKVLSFGDSIEDIGISAFKRMDYEGVPIDLEFTGATNLKNIGRYAFSGTKEEPALIESGVSLPKNLKTFDFSSFCYTNITDIYAKTVEKIILPEKENPAITIDEWYPKLTSLHLPLSLKPVVEANPDFFVAKTSDFYKYYN